MKENLSAFGIFLGFFMLAFSLSLVPKTLINDYLIYGSIIVIGLIVSLIYIYKNEITDNMEYLYIPIRSTISLGCILVSSFLWINYYYRNENLTIVNIPVNSCFLDYETTGSKFNRKTTCKSAFEINYNGQSKNIVWDNRLDDNLMKSVKSIEIMKSEGFFGIDIIEDMNLVY
jgi:hypothetical protein